MTANPASDRTPAMPATHNDILPSDSQAAVPPRCPACGDVVPMHTVAGDSSLDLTHVFFAQLLERSGLASVEPQRGSDSFEAQLNTHHHHECV